MAAAQLLDEPNPNDEDLAGDTLLSGSRGAELPLRNDHGMVEAASYGRQLQERADSARRKQDVWYNETIHQSHVLESTSRQLFQQAKDERERAMRQAMEQQLEAQRQAIVREQAEHHARLAEEAEQQRLALEIQRRAREEAEEAERVHLAAEEEERRREREEAERRRRERERECAVCLDVNDMDNMVEVPCRHWYCRDHLRGKET